MPHLCCSICGYQVPCDDEFEAGLFTAWHLRDAHRAMDLKDIQTRDGIDDETGEPHILIEAAPKGRR